MKFESFKNEKGESIESQPEFQQLLTDFRWALERTKSYANSKGAHNNVTKSEILLDKYDFVKID